MLEPETENQLPSDTEKHESLNISRRGGPTAAERYAVFAAKVLQPLIGLGWSETEPEFQLLAGSFKPTQPLAFRDRTAFYVLEELEKAGAIRLLCGPIPELTPRTVTRAHGRESEKHIHLKGTGLAFLDHLGCTDGDFELPAHYGSSDVKSEAGSVTVEVGNTDAQRAIEVIQGNPVGMIVIPYQYERGLCIHATERGLEFGDYERDRRFRDVAHKMSQWQSEGAV